MKFFFLVFCFLAASADAGSKVLLLDCKQDEGRVVSNFDPSAKFRTVPIKLPKAPEGLRKYALFGDAIVILEVDGKVLPPDLKENAFAKVGAETLYQISGTDKHGSFVETVNFIDWKPETAKIQHTLISKSGSVNTPYTCKVTEKR